MSKNDWRILWFLSLIGTAVLVFIFGYQAGRSKYDVSEKADTAVITTSYHSPKPLREVGVGNVDIPLVVYSENGKTEVRYVPEMADSGTLPKNLYPKDTIQVQVPITQKVYRDSNYTAYISGYRANLDSINVQSKIITYTKTVTKRHVFNFGLTGGIGYGVINKKPDVFIGLGLTYRFK